MIFGVLNPEKIWHQQLVHLPTSPVYCSHFTLGNPKVIFQQYYSFILPISYVISKKQTVNSLPTTPKKCPPRYLVTRGSAIAEEPRDALRQLKYYGRFLTELLTRSSANPEEPCEHTVSWNRVNCCTNVRRIACENVCNRWMTFKVMQGHCRCHHLIGHILFPISLPL